MVPHYPRAVGTDSILVTSELFRVMDLIGVVVMGIAGGAIAARMNFDAVGFAVVGIISGLGGGIIRDVILDAGPPASFQDPIYFVCALAGAAFSFLVVTEHPAWRGIITVLDTTALALWAATGTVKSLGLGLQPLPAMLLGVVSAVGGGATRDVIIGRVPQIFGGGPLYASCALLTTIGTWLVQDLDLPEPWVIAPVVLGTTLAMLAAFRSWHLPRHEEWQVTLSKAQLDRLLRRVRTDERRRVEHAIGNVPQLSQEDLGDVDPRGETAELLEEIEQDPHPR